MRKYIICIGLFLFALAGCQEKEILHYMEKDGLQFDYDTSGMSGTYKFIDQTEEREGRTCYLGDNLLLDTVKLKISVRGYNGIEDRDFALKTVLVEGQDANVVPPVEFLPVYKFPANRINTEIPVIVLRPAGRIDYVVGITFDTEHSDPMFENGVIEKSVFKLRVSNRYPEPSGWDKLSKIFGEYSEEKYAFMVTVTSQLFNSQLPGDRWIPVNKALREALDKYNQEHEIPKDFEFPVYDIPAWWPEWEMYLGEYSSAKKVFLVNFAEQYCGLPPEYFDQAGGDAVQWDQMNSMLRETYDQWNADHPDNQLEFPQFPNLSSGGEPSWWPGQEMYLGEYSDAKRIFLVDFAEQYGLPSEYFDELGGDAVPWNQMNSALRDAYDQWNADYPDDVLDFPQFPELSSGGEPSWWPDQEMYLGEYSDAKRAFLLDFAEQYGLSSESFDEYGYTVPWGDMNSVLRDAYDQWNTENPNDPLQFKQFPDLSKDPGKK